KVVVPTDLDVNDFQNTLSSGSINLKNCGFDYNSANDEYALWCNDNRIWIIKSPQPFSTSGWTIKKYHPSVGPNGNPINTTGVLGKFKFAPNLNAYVALHNGTMGNVWVYKPHNWTLPT